MLLRLILLELLYLDSQTLQLRVLVGRSMVPRLRLETDLIDLSYMLHVENGESSFELFWQFGDVLLIAQRKNDS